MGRRESSLMMTYFNRGSYVVCVIPISHRELKVGIDRSRMDVLLMFQVAKIFPMRNTTMFNFGGQINPIDG